MTPNKKLNQLTCKPTTPKLSHSETQDYLKHLQNHWHINTEGKLEANIRLKNFKHAMALANLIADCAEQENHHPDLQVSYGRLDITLWTHDVQNLSLNDFILAAKIDDIISTHHLD